MRFRTEIEREQLAVKIGYEDAIFTIGSCFSENIAQRLKQAKFDVTTNPTGTLFNSASIIKTIERLSRGKEIDIEELKPYDAEDERGGWFHYDFHSRLSAPTREETLELINNAVKQGHEALERSSCVIITLGTAWVFELDETDEVVANCHKQPHSLFCRGRQSSEEITVTMHEMLEGYLKDKRVILTLSPVRHMGDGLVENSLSKSLLRVSIEDIISLSTTNNICYFPAYEAVVDDLRDYRYYADDMVHPTALAVNYVWELFREVAITKESQELCGQVERVMQIMNHKVINPLSAGYRKLCALQLTSMRAMKGVDMSSEINFYEEQLNKSEGID